MFDFIKKIRQRNVQRLINREQELLNELYEEEGLTDFLLVKQVILNEKKHELDVSADTDKNNAGFVQ